MSMVHRAILDWLQQEEVPFREVHHEPTLTSEQSAAARGADGSSSTGTHL